MSTDITKLIERAAEKAMIETAKREVMPVIQAEIKRRVRSKAKAWLTEHTKELDATIDKLINKHLKAAAAIAVKQATKDIKVTTATTRRRYY